MKLPACPCCGLYAMDTQMETIADYLVFEFPDAAFTSGCRCQLYNASPRIRGGRTSGHLPIWGMNGIQAVAFDVALENWTEARARFFLYRAIQHGALGVGYMPDDHAFHIDRKPRPTRFTLWRVDSGKYNYFF